MAKAPPQPPGTRAERERQIAAKLPHAPPATVKALYLADRAADEAGRLRETLGMLEAQAERAGQDVPPGLAAAAERLSRRVTDTWMGIRQAATARPRAGGALRRQASRLGPPRDPSRGR